LSFKRNIIFIFRPKYAGPQEGYLIQLKLQ